MAKTAQEKQAALLEANQKKIDAVQARIDKAAGDEGKAEKIAAAEKTLANAQARLDRLNNGAAGLEAEKARLEQERVWLQSMPGATSSAGTDAVFVDTGDEVDEDDLDDETSAL